MSAGLHSDRLPAGGKALPFWLAPVRPPDARLGKRAVCSRASRSAGWRSYANWVAAAAGGAFAATVSDPAELSAVLKEALDAVHGGRSAVVAVHLPVAQGAGTPAVPAGNTG